MKKTMCLQTYSDNSAIIVSTINSLVLSQEVNLCKISQLGKDHASPSWCQNQIKITNSCEKKIGFKIYTHRKKIDSGLRNSCYNFSMS